LNFYLLLQERDLSLVRNFIFFQWHQFQASGYLDTFENEENILEVQNWQFLEFFATDER